VWVWVVPLVNETKIVDIWQSKRKIKRKWRGRGRGNVKSTLPLPQKQTKCAYR